MVQVLQTYWSTKILKPFRFESSTKWKGNIKNWTRTSYDLRTTRSTSTASTGSQASSMESEESKRDSEKIPATKLFSFTKMVKLDQLNDHEKIIHNAHISALEKSQTVYKDPSTGYTVLTRLAHLKRGKCCGNACRHCPFGHENVPAAALKKRFNSAFYI